MTGARPRRLLLHLRGWNQPALRAATALLAGSLVLQELRYLLASGDEAHTAFAHHGHEYLAYVTAAVGVLAALVRGRLLVSFAAGIPASRRRIGLRRLWLLANAALLTVYTGQ